MDILKFVSAVLLALWLGCSAHSAYAARVPMDWSYTLRVLQLMYGDWYDESGAKVLTIYDDRINGCQVLDGYSFAGGTSDGMGVFDVREAAGIRELQLEWKLHRRPDDSLVMDSTQTLHRRTPYYYESVGGLYLGMSKRAVIELIGSPTHIITEDSPLQLGREVYSNGLYKNSWYYRDQGLIVTFSDDFINRIILLKYSPLRFDKSGINCANTPDEIGAAYLMNGFLPWPTGDFEVSYPIGYAEYISFGKDMSKIMLS